METQFQSRVVYVKRKEEKAVPSNQRWKRTGCLQPETNAYKLIIIRELAEGSGSINSHIPVQLGFGM